MLYAVQALADKWRSLERRKDRQRQAFDAAVALSTDTDFQQSLEEAKEQVDQAVSIEVQDIYCNYGMIFCLVWSMVAFTSFWSAMQANVTCCPTLTPVLSSQDVPRVTSGSPPRTAHYIEWYVL